MAVVQNTYTGNGSTVLYSLSFSYLDQADVKVSVNGTIVTNYIFATASSIQFLTAPGAGAAIRIYRETDIDQASATIFPGSAIKAQDLNDNFTQTLYAVQESNFEADSATTTANTALTTANTAISTANAATSTANTALSNSAAAVSTANTASTNASNAVTTANTASSNASAAVTTANAATVTANSAASTAATALSTANTASSNASAAVSTANTASTNASNAVTTANTALSTANTASSNASTAVTTANNAVSTANGAVSTANTALSTANAAISAVASAVIYTPVANLTALAALTPSNGDYFELTDSTGAEGSALITGVTVGLVGAPGLTFRLRYDAPPGIFTFLGYFANDSETRYLKLAGGTLTGQLRGDDSTSASTPGFAFDGDPNTGIGRPGADELALITGGTARLTIDPAGAVAVAGSLSQGGNAVVVTTDSRLSDTRVPTDGSVTNTKVAAAAAIDGTKISPNFGSQNVVTTGTVSGASLIPTSSSVPTNGVYLPSANNVAISTNGTQRLAVDTAATTSTLPVVHPLGAVGTPSITFTGDLNTGIWSPAADTVAASTGGSERLRIDSSGRVGIGTTSPGNSFVVSNGGAVGLEVDPVGTNSAPRLVSYNRSSSQFAQLTLDGATNVFATSGTERARIDSSGRLLVGTSSAAGRSDLLQIEGEAGLSTGIGSISLRRGFAPGSLGSGSPLGRIDFGPNDGGTGARIEAVGDAAMGTNDYPSRLVFSTTADGASSPTERMRIQNDGRVSIGAFVVDPGIGNANNGINLGFGYGAFSRDSLVPLFANRNTNDGVIVSLAQGGTEEGTISVSGNTVSYNQFLGSHWAALSDWSRPQIKLGTILETINELTDWKLGVIEVDGEQKKICYNGTAAPGDTVSVEYEGETYEGTVELETNPEFNKAVKVKVNDTTASKAVYGVFVGWNNDSNLDGGTWNDMYVGAVGNYVIRMAAGQEPKIGDLVEADGTGCAVVQDDDIIRAKTVAKITSIIPQVTYDDGSFLVTCVLYCG